MDSKRDKASDVNPALLHKKMLQLLSSLWVTRAVGTFARLGLADVMEDGVEDYAAIAAARGLVADRVYRLLRALSTLGIVAESRESSNRARHPQAAQQVQHFLVQQRRIDVGRLVALAVHDLVPQNIAPRRRRGAAARPA